MYGSALCVSVWGSLGVAGSQFSLPLRSAVSEWQTKADPL
jgi:hypothetical protein